MKKISIGTRAFLRGPDRDRPVAFDECVRTIKRLGFDGLELGAWSPHPTPSSHATPAARAALRREIDGAGLGVSGLAADFHGQCPFQDDGAAYLMEFATNLHFCTDLGIKTLVVTTGAPPDALIATGVRQAIAATIDMWKACAREAAAKGVRLVWEFGPAVAFHTPGQILQVVEGVDEPNFGVLFDTSLAHEIVTNPTGGVEALPGGVLELLGMLQGQVGAIRVGGTEGPVPLDRMIAALLDSGVPTAWWCLDPGDGPAPPEAIEGSRTTLGRYLELYDKELQPLRG